MNENNTFSGALAWIGTVSLVLGAVLWLFGIFEQNERSFTSDGTEGLVQLALANQLFTLGTAAVLLWLVVRAIIAQMVYKPRPTRAQADGS